MSDRVAIGDWDLDTLYAVHVRIVRGLQLSGRLHLGDLGDYFGAMPQQLALQDQGELLHPANTIVFRQNDAHRVPAISQETMARGRDEIGL